MAIGFGSSLDDAYNGDSKRDCDCYTKSITEQYSVGINEVCGKYLYIEIKYLYKPHVFYLYENTRFVDVVGTNQFEMSEINEVCSPESPYPIPIACFESTYRGKYLLEKTIDVLLESGD